MTHEPEARGSAPGKIAGTSLALLTRAQQGDGQALDELVRRFLPRLKRWIAGRLPAHSRGLSDTDDLVQDTVIRTLRNLNEFEIRHDAGLQSYLRSAVWNRLREEIRRASRRPTGQPMDEFLATPDASPLECAIGAAALDRYETALEKLDHDERSAVVGRLEFGYSYGELAVMLNRRTPDAVRNLVERAIPRLAEWIEE